MDDLFRIAYFRHPLLKLGVSHELSLIDVHARIDFLLSASSSSDAHVDLRVVDRFQGCHDTAQVSRFAATLECEPDGAWVSLSSPVADDAPPTFEAMPIDRPGDDPVPLKPIGPINAPNGAVLPSDLTLDGPWLVVMRHGEKVRVRPVRIDKPIESARCGSIGSSGSSRLAEALSIGDRELRTEKIAAVMDDMLTGEDSEPVEQAEQEWSFLTDSLLCAEGLPATALDLCRVLVTKPRLLVRSLFRLESAPRQLLWQLERELPFSWLLIRRDFWWCEARQAFNRLRQQLAGVIDDDRDRIAQEHVEKILNEGAYLFPALNTVCTDVAMRMEGHRPSDGFLEELLGEWRRQTTEQIRLRANLDDWPGGYGRREWTKELEKGELLGSLNMWQDPNAHSSRQPLFDTPIAAAWCCFLSKPTNRTVFFVKHIRACDSEWFDLAYSTAWFLLARKQDNSRKRK